MTSRDAPLARQPSKRLTKPMTDDATLSPDDRLARLESRVRLLEDRAEIAALVAAYGPAVDRLDGAAVDRQFAADARYVIAGTVVAAPDLGGLVDFDTHRDLVSAGCGHILTPPDIHLDGDEATAVNHSVVLRHEGSAWSAVRLSANHWHFRRTADGWRVQERRNHLLDGAAAARELLDPAGVR